MANPTRKEYPVRKYVGFSDEQWRPIRKWIRAQRPRISEAEGLRRLVDGGMREEKIAARGRAFVAAKRRLAEQPTRKRAEP